MSKNSSVGEVGIRDLMQGAGRRPAVPSEDLAEIRSVAKQQWREMARMERERSRFGRNNTLLALAASVLLAVALGWWLMPEWADWGRSAPDRVASVELVRGDVLFNGAKMTIGSEVSVGAVIETAREGAGTALRLGEGQSVRLDQGTRVRFTSESSFELIRGAVYVDTAKAARRAGVEISTPHGMVRDIGTQFQVRIADGDGDGEGFPFEVRVREGEVLLEQSGSEPRSVKAGEELTLQRAGTVEHGTVASHGAAWDWVAAVTPAMDIEGASLAAYLEWVSRETGRELRYSDESLAESAKTIMLSGTIEDHTPEESLSILPSSGLGHRIEDGWLLIEQP